MNVEEIEGVMLVVGSASDAMTQWVNDGSCCWTESNAKDEPDLYNLWVAMEDTWNELRLRLKYMGGTRKWPTSLGLSGLNEL